MSVIADDTPFPNRTFRKSRSGTMLSPPRVPDKVLSITSPGENAKIKTLVNKTVTVLFDKSKTVSEQFQVRVA